MAMQPGRRRTVVADINVTPMADIMIVLLIIFMVTVPILNAPPVSLPDARHGRDSAENALTLVVTAAGARIGTDDPMSLDRLTEYLAARVELSREPLTVLIQADQNADYARVAGVMQACRSARIEEIGLATQTVGDVP
jgi:biopolymer transport protein TolR